MGGDGPSVGRTETSQSEPLAKEHRVSATEGYTTLGWPASEEAPQTGGSALMVPAKDSPTHLPHCSSLTEARLRLQ